MYEVIQATPKEIAIVYFIILASCFFLYPITMIVMNIMKEGSKK